MKSIILFAFVLVAGFSSAQTLKFKIKGQKDTTINLVKYFGKGLYYADTAEIKNGIVQFDGAKQKPGILALYIPGQSMLEFIYNNEDINIEATAPDMLNTATVKTSEENKVFFPYIQFLNEKRGNAKRWQEQRADHEEGSDMYEQLTKQIDQATAQVEEYQLNLIKEHPNMFLSKVVKMSMDIKIPDAPVDAEGNIIDSTWQFKYFREHYFDNIDFSDDRLVSTPVFHNKFSHFFSKSMMVQHWDTVLYYAFDLCDQMDKKSDMFQYAVTYITSTFEKSKIMGMDKVFVMMGERYYCAKDEKGDPIAHWMPEDKLEELCERVSKQRRLVMGEVPPNLVLLDSTNGNWENLYKTDAEYTILYFWDPQCGHCKKITPKLGELYDKKWKDRDVEVFAVGKAIGEDFDKWKAFIQTNNLDFINVAVTDSLYTVAKQDARQLMAYTTLESLNYQQTYDIYASPTVFVLDKDKKIIGKKLTISQLEDLIDRLQGKTDLEKLFPPEEDIEDEQMH